jgi:hypothetical protein
MSSSDVNRWLVVETGHAKKYPYGASDFGR